MSASSPLPSNPAAAAAAALPPSRLHGSHRLPSHHSHTNTTKQQQQQQQHQPQQHHHLPHPPPPHHLISPSPPPPPPQPAAGPPPMGFPAHFPPITHAATPFQPLFHAVPVTQPHGQSTFYRLFALLIAPSPLLARLSPSLASHLARSTLFTALSTLLTPLCPAPYPPFLFGSTPLHTYLPSGDLDVGLVVRGAGAGDGVMGAGVGAGAGAVGAAVEGERVLLRVKEILEEEERRWKKRKKQQSSTALAAADDTREGETSSEESPTPSATDSPASSPSAVSSSAPASSSSSSVLPVHSVTFINASEVKLVKCMIGPILVDISTNTSAALATVCFLEQADREIDRSLLLHYPPVAPSNSQSLPPSTSPPHLLKQSILLIKSWCLFESHILASHHSLLSTYCLETLVIYILNHYHCHLHHTAADPFVVLSLFMHVFAVFNWEDWGLTVTGPVRREEMQSPMFPSHHLFALERSTASVPPLLASPFPHANHPLLSPSFFYTLYATYSLPTAPPARPFLAKHMNVVDPLDLTNNLGRSVSFSNLWRVRLCLRKGVSDMVRVMAEGRECVEAMLREMEEVGKRGVGGGGGGAGGGVKGGKGRVWMEESDLLLSEPTPFQELIGSLAPISSTSAQSSVITCPSLPFSSALLSRLSAHHQLVRSLFAHTWQHHTDIPRPDCHLVQRLRAEGALMDDEHFRHLLDSEEKDRAIRPASTLSPTSASSSLSSIAASSLASEPLSSTLARRLLAMPSQPRSLSRDDSSLSLSLPPRAPASSRSLFISTLPHPTPARDVVAVSGTFSPLIEPSSCPPPSTTLSPRHSASCPPSPAASVSPPALSPDHSPSPSPSPPLSDPLSSSLSALWQMFYPLKQLHMAALQSAFPAVVPPPFHPWQPEGHRPLEAHRNGMRDRQQQHQQPQHGKGQGKNKHKGRDRADRRDEKERDFSGLFHPPTSPASASPMTGAYPADVSHNLPAGAGHASHGKRNKKNGYRQQQQQQQQQYHNNAPQQQHQQHQHQLHPHHMHGLSPQAAFHMFAAPAPYPQPPNVRRQYVNSVPQPQPPFPPHAWHAAYPLLPHHMQPSQPPPPPPPAAQPPLAVSPSLSPASPRPGVAASGGAVSRIHMLPNGVPGQAGVLQHVRAFLEPDDARSFAAVLQPAQHQQPRVPHQQTHTRGGSGGATVPVGLDSGGVRKSTSPQKQKQRQRGQAERTPDASSAASLARPNRRRSDGEFPQPIGVDELVQPVAVNSSTGMSSATAPVTAGSSPSLSMARSWSTAVGSARTSPSLQAVPLSLSSSLSSLSSPALPSLLSDPSLHPHSHPHPHAHPQPWITQSPPPPSPPPHPTQPPGPPSLLHPAAVALSAPVPSAGVAVLGFAGADVGGVGGGMEGGSGGALGVAVGSGSSGGVVQYPGPPKGERRHKAKKERAMG